MKKLYLIRHAKSSWKDNSLQDFDRPLNKRGKRDAPEMGRRLQDRSEFPDLILSSSAVRAAKTARAVAKEIGYPKKKIDFRDELYHASAKGMLDLVRQTHNEVQVLFLFGHNPGLNDFANQLCSQTIDNIVTCGIYALECPIQRWEELRLDSLAELLYYDFPKKELSH